ncbi:MAG: FHA domain-containing protein [Planctomycetota bacterium]
MPYLEIRLGPDSLLLRFVGRIDFVFGRLPKADIQLRDMKVSRLHTQVFMDSHGSAFVRDLGSSGGTGYNNKKLPKGVIAPLSDGVKIRVGDARIIYYDSEPPVNAIDPPGVSEPRGIIRTNERPRVFESDATVTAAEKVTEETVNGPAEAPPIVRPEDFTDDGESAPVSKKQPAAPEPAPKRKQKSNTGIVEAPWEKQDGGVKLDPSEMVDGAANQHGQKKRGTRKITGRLVELDQVDPVAPTAAVQPPKPAQPIKMPSAKPPIGQPQTGAGAFSPPPPPPKQKASSDSGGMPTISLGDAPRADFNETGDDNSDVHDPLTDTQIANYLGGGDRGQFDRPSFGESNRAEKITDELVFGPRARLDEVETDRVADEEVPSYDDAGTPPPTNDRGATDDRAFKPRKTRKLMKRRTERITNKTNNDMPPQGAKTEAIPAPPISSANTLFVPKPIGLVQPKNNSIDKATGKPKTIAENRNRSDRVDDMGAGPGGDTVAMDMDMLADMRKQLEPGEPLEQLGDSETIKTAPDDEDLEDAVEDLDILDFSGSSRQHQGSFEEEADSLSDDKNAEESSDPDTITD